MWFFSKSKTELLNPECDQLCRELDMAIGAANNIFANPFLHINENAADVWMSSYSYLIPKTEKSNIRQYKKCINGNVLLSKAKAFSVIPGTLRANITNHNIRVELEKECQSLVDSMAKATSEAEGYLSIYNDYVDVSVASEWKSKHDTLIKKVKSTTFFTYNGCKTQKIFEEKKQGFILLTETFGIRILKHNDDLARRQISEGYNLIGLVENQRLDEQQMLAIVKPSKNHLIIAGAGTGKTTTIVGKIKYLLNKKLCNPEDILVLSFTNASASEMSKRIEKEAGCPIAASTFHKLGLEIIKEVEGKVPKIYSKSISSFVRDQLNNLMKNPDYLNNLCGYALYYRSALRTEGDFASNEEYQDYLSTNVPTTLNGETVKSYGELDIANFLYRNQIAYEYEASYKFDTNNEQYGQYHPDFYLTDYDVYIEYFGIDKDGNVADFFKGKDGRSAKEVYQAGIKWKRQIHSEKQTKMIECYAYEKFDGSLLKNLEDKLTENGIRLNPLSTEELWDKISEENSGLLDGIVELFGTVISLIKSNNYHFSYVEELAANYKDATNNLYILSLIKPIYLAYDKMLIENNEIDFSDMINKATFYVKEGKYKNPYKFVIVDEYQDISKARFNLLYELRKSSFYELFCVGDDWQSIYRFAGSDINYIVDFENYWGPTGIGRIETTYRFTNSLIDISSNFIMQNPRQIRKSIRGKSADAQFSLGVISGYTDKYAMQFMMERLYELPKDASVYFIGRYSFDVNLLKENTDLQFRYDNVHGETVVTYYKRKDLNMRYLTAHRSKGLQADYVFIINNKDSKMGFPSMIQDASIMDLLLEKAEVYPYAEERRLFYVALTRAKKKVFLVTLEGRESVFANELIETYGQQIKNERFTCPLCGGKLVKRTATKGNYAGKQFWGCGNYPNCKFTRNISG